MREVPVFEAKNKLSALLDEVETGAEIAITRRGRLVARLVPPQPLKAEETARRAAEEIRSLARQMKNGPRSWAEWKKFRDEGRR
jgi:prevent-host-death family protein